ncbi:MAG TPA: hypothetical protein VK644_02075, partial [Chitinophagaceae bacterium]|nr:hypothetical protein [Chitinophagaceae bacterium]
MTKIKMGDIFEISTPKGNAYLHYVYSDKTIGSLIRVLSGLYTGGSVDLCKIAASNERFMVFFPLSAAFRRKIVKYAGHCDIQDFVKPAYMREENNVRGVFLGWYIIDTQTWHRQLVKELTPAHKQLSPWGCWNDTLLIEKLMEGWT